VTCRWCGRTDSVELIARPRPGEPEATAPQPAGSS
jgi:hypothetical protein